MSLYEAMTQSRRKSSTVRRPADYGRVLERLRPEKTTEDKPSEESSDVQIPMPHVTTTWFRRPRTVQFNTGRIEFSLSYPVVIAILLGFILLVLLAFRIGQYYSFHGEQGRTISGGQPSGHGVPAEPGPANANPSGVIPAQPEKAESASVRNVADLSARSVADESSVETKVEFTTPQAGNVIVLVEYSKRADLVPAQSHFAKFGVETEIVSWGGKYFLITKNRYEGFGAESDGYEAKQKIVEVGAKYKAPQGYETFAPLFFKDAYGKKIE